MLIMYEKEKLTSLSFPLGSASPLVGLNEDQMLARVVMLKRMKRLLIAEWHPVINVLLSDYENDIRRIGLTREPLDYDDEFDPLDRDFDDGNGD